MTEPPPSVSEYWFMDYYRVVKTRTGDKYLVSVDVYRRNYEFGESEEICVKNGEYCILYARIDPSKTGIRDVYEIIVTGIKAGGILETVNVRWMLGHDPKYSEIEEIFYESWRLIGCKGPRKDPWDAGCPETPRTQSHGDSQ